MDAQDLLDFDKLVGSNLVQFVSDYFTFETDSLPTVISFFKGSGDFLDSKHTSRLSNLVFNGEDLRRRIQHSSHIIQTLKQQEIAFIAEEMLLNIAYFSKIDKFSRSTTKLPSITRGVVVNHTIARGTLEEVSRNELGSNNFDNDWIDIAKYNALYEVDYDYDGGKRIDLVLPLSSVQGADDAVLDYMFRENLLGKDIDKKITFENDDFNILTTEATFVQSVDILSALEKGDIPEFPSLGRLSLIGQETSVFAYASLVRQLQQVFASDATISSLQIFGYTINEGDINLDYSVTNIRDDIAIQQSINIQ